MEIQNSVFIGENAGGKLVRAKNCVFVGLAAGADIVEGEDIVIIGHGIRSLDRSQENVVFIQDKVAIDRDIYEKLFPGAL